MNNLELFDMIVHFIRSFLEQNNVAKLTMEQEMKISIADQLVSVLEECSPELKTSPLEEKLSLVLKGFMSARENMPKPPTPTSEPVDKSLGSFLNQNNMSIDDLIKFFSKSFMNPQGRDTEDPQTRLASMIFGNLLSK